ncbi:MAG TPA: acetamidase/formamidase family protein [Candidatus Eisenbacteria bacterium]|nr:acetamidase/formamidase family protein [Candidatus Eisenbacteria bacterium]
MSLHEVEPAPSTVHGCFSRDLPPILTVDPGDRIRYRTLDAGWSLIEQADPYGLPAKFERPDPKRDRGHALCGPVAVRGAKAGMTLVVRLISIRTGRWGWSSAGGWKSALNDRLGVAEGEERVLRWALDPDQGTATNQHGRTLRLRPFLGLIGMPPAEPGAHPTIPPRFCGGNIDCKELIAGSTLYLPIAVDGALLSLGDGHGMQGDGEVAGPALECPMDPVEIEVGLADPLPIAMPRARTPDAWITFGFHEDLDEAMATALDSMLSLMNELHGIERREALSLASLAVDLRITQVVNGVRGVHAVLRDGAIGQTSMLA